MSAQSTEPKETVPSVATHRFAKLNPFRDDDDEGGDDLGEEINETSIAGGGRAIGGSADIEARKKLRVSHVLRSFLAQEGEISKDAVGGDDSETNHSEAVQALLAKPQFVHPEYVNDRNYGLAEYFISSSHNTYLVGKQLYGSADSMSYKHHLSAGARCVEIDAWDSDDKAEPKVTHGYTLTEHVSFRHVCEAIKNTLEEEITAISQRQAHPPLPIFISLENHCSPGGQERLAAIMEEVFGDRLITQHAKDQNDPIKLDELTGKILVMVEYYGLEKDDVPDDIPANAKQAQDSDDKASKEHREKKDEKPAKIIPQLAALGVYAQSMKPKDDAWLKGTLTEPQNHLVNVEERAVLELIEKKQGQSVSKHNANHLMRIYPKGTRINSKNLNPVPFWGVGAQVCALNWQTFDASMQINEALFAGTDGYVLKPPYLRKDGSGQAPKGQKVQLTLEIAGATDLAVPEGREKDIKPYVTCTLYYPNQKGKPEKEKTSHYRVHKHKQLFGHEQPPPTSPVWEPTEKLQWTYEDDDLAFLRILIKSDDAFARNPAFLTSAVRLSSIPKGWHFIRLLNLRGGETKATLLARYHKKNV
ncbi:PLC-like phosphodiesterase [Meira miltonrushii]|uniref:Phosphoinositide phospholipase C n=1 Tax=Meira miltonrushii TaxID=1280837 RepID=A0A316V2L7_9BASI|nr:PLC-like phosphodiesterase [Meira miltonrushii]PWN31796.1 PLC-like phosphodiesterase [Meira miltonrushii]